MAIIFLNRFFHPDHSATSQLVSDLAFDLAAGGRSVTVITSRLLYDDAHVELPAKEKKLDVTIHRVWTSRRGRDDHFGRVLDYLTFYMSASWRLWRVVSRNDVVVTMTDPPMLSVLTTAICRWRGAKAINWLQDLFPEIAEVMWERRHAFSLGFSILRRLRNQSLRGATANVVIGSSMAERLAAMRVEATQVRLIPNWADGAVIKPVGPTANPFRADLALGDAILIGYSGNLGRVHDIDTLLDSMAILADDKKSEFAPGSYPRVVWLFIGGGALMPRLKAEIARRGIKNVEFRPYQDKASLAQSLSAADIHIVSLRPEFEGLVVPSKVYGIAAAGRPIVFIGDRQGEVARLIERFSCGHAVTMGDGAGLARVVMDIATKPAERRRMGEAARRAFDLEFDRSAAFARWLDVIEDVRHERTLPSA